jgi:hypothetical protein
MHKNATKCNKTQSKWCINKHGASKIIDTFGTYHSPNTTEAHHNLLELSHKMEDPTTMGRLRAVTEPIQAWGNLHNLIKGSQELPPRHHKAWEDLHNLIGGPQEIAMEAPQRLGRSP